MLQLFVWRLGSQDFAMPAAGVMLVVRAVAMTKAASAVSFACGEINFRGKIVPVIDLRKRFRLPERPLDLADHFVIVATAQRTLALWVDAAHGVVEYHDEAAVPQQSTASGAGAAEDVVELRGGLLLVPDLERCLAAGYGEAQGEMTTEAGQ
jgi:purine-binding chemotaxis protein CheW